MGSVEPTAGRPETPTGSSTHDHDEALTPDEADLLAEIGAAIREADPVPESLVAAAKASWTWRTIDAELASLVGDTAEAPVVTRAAGDAPRMLTFTAGATALILEVTAAGRLRRLLGQIVAPRRAEVEVRHSGGSASVTADEMGRFRVDGIPRGPLSLVCRFLDGVSGPIATSWVAV